MRARWPVREKEINVHIYTNAITFSDDDESDDGLISDNMLIRENQRSGRERGVWLVSWWDLQLDSHAFTAWQVPNRVEMSHQNRFASSQWPFE